MQERKYSEIGSEFWLQEVKENRPLYVLSGRTAIDLMLQDATRNGHPVQSVYLPAWCCDSMLQPFFDRGVEIIFYDLSIEGGSVTYYIDTNLLCDVFYVTNFFGYHNTINQDIIKLFQNRGSLVLYDKTHSLLMDDDTIVSYSDYTIASIRKWLGIPCGAYLLKRGQNLKTPYLKDFPYLGFKIAAMTQKAAYISGNKSINKQMFLDNYSRFNCYLAESYRDYKMDDLSLKIWQESDMQTLKRTRRSNAVFLHACLKDIPQVKPLFSFVEVDCPFFVPVILESKEERDALRKYLTANSIYCPIHWPKPSQVEQHMKVNELFNRELSLLCDQRYELDDMQYIINKIIKFYH